MGITEKISEIYASAEENFYKLLDWFETKGIPVYNYNDFFESRGIPVFPLTITLIVLVLLLLFWAFTVSTSVSPTLSLNIKDDNDNPLLAVNVIVSKETELFNNTRSHAGEIKLGSMPIGTILHITGTKDGYEPGATDVTITAEKVSVSLQLTKITKPITGLLKLVDSKTGTPIKGALVTATWGKDNIRSVKTDENGIAKLENVPQGEKIQVSIKADNYEELTDLLSFDELQTQTIDLPAKTTASFGSANFVITVYDKDTKALLDGVTIKILDATTGSTLFDSTTQKGQYLAQLPKGTSVRVLASKTGYIRFDSTEDSQPTTIRDEEEILDIYLEKGGQKIKVNVKQKDSLIPVVAATVSLYNSNGEILDSNKTGFGGSVSFNDLNADSNYFAAAFLEGYNGETKKFSPGQTNEIDLTIEIATTQNSAALNSFVYQSNGDAANGATLDFFEITNDGLYPTGVPSQTTGFDGYATIKMPTGKNILVTARKGIESGDANKIIVPLVENSVSIRMHTLSTVKTLLIYDQDQRLVPEGYAKIESATGDTLFDGNFLNGRIDFDAKENKTANLTITTPDGNVFTEQINLPDGNTPIEITLGKDNNNALAPQIKFLGIVDSEGKTVNALTPGKEYWLKLETSWLKGVYNGGVHVRLGNDETKFADSEDVVITGYNAAGADSFYGRTWNALPTPGNEAIDYRNIGKPGQDNKWLELYYTNPQGTKIIKVKVRAKQTTSAQSITLHYRAWAVLGNNFERNPIDKELGKEKFTDSKTGLYADTIDTELSLFDAQPQCNKDICISFAFITKENETIPTTEFKAIKDKVFALEATIKSKKTSGALIKAQTQTDKPKLFFTGVEIESFTEFIDNNSTQPNIEVNDLSLVQGAERKVRFYFKPRLTGNASIKVQLISDQTATSDEFFFNIFEERLMTATIIPETVSVGVDFAVQLKDASGNPIENATLQLKNDAGSIVTSMVGDKTPGKGSAGSYSFKNSYSAGMYSLEITAQTFTPLKIDLPIGSTDLLKLSAEEIILNIPKGEKNATGYLQLKNSATLDMQNISFEIVKTESFPAELDVTASVPTTLKKNSQTRIELSALYLGDINSTKHGEATIKIKGSVAGKYPATTEARIIVNYNQKLAPSCLEIDKQSVSLSLSGEQGDQQEETIQIKNNCGIPLTIDARTELNKKVLADEQLDVQVTSLSLEPNQASTITVTAINKILRKYDFKQTRTLDIVLSATQLEKHIPLTITLWDRAYAIAVRNSIVLWLAQSKKGEPVVASTPLFIQNVSDGDIENISIDVAQANWEGITVRVLPLYGTGQVLKKRTSLLPVRIVVAEMKGGTDKGKLVHGFLVVKGNIKGRQYELRKIDVWLHVSALNCLKAYKITDLDFESTVSGAYGPIEKRISIRNTCEEAVRITDVENPRIGPNTLSVLPMATEVLEKDSEAEFRLLLTRGFDDKEPGISIAIIGLTMLTNKFITSDRLNGSVAIGEKSIETGLASAPYKVNICNPNGTISKDKKEVRFPLIAKTPDCTKAYCDAEQAAEYISKKLIEKINIVKNAVSRGNADLANFPGCAGSRACSFNRMGIKSDNFDLYLSNDVLTEMLLKKAIADKSELREYTVNYCAGKECDVEAIAATGFPGLMFISNALRGCGKYRLSINGAVFASGIKIQETGYTLAVNISGEKATTPECTNKITNAMNFLPQDPNLTENISYGAWPGMVEAKTELEEAGKLTAKELFTKEERSTTSSNSNELILNIGELNAGIVKLSMEQTGSADTPKKITATINKALGTEKDALQKDMAKEAANAIASLKTQRLEEGKSCVSADDSFMVIGSYSKFGEMTIVGANELKMKQGNIDLTSQDNLKTHSCVDLNVVSKISEEVYLITNADEIENKPYGIAKVYLRKKESTGNYSIINNTTIAKLVQDPTTKEFKYSFQLCAIGSKEMSLAKKGIDLTVKAKNRIEEMRESKPKTVKAIPCATHPYDLLNEIDKLPPGEYYTTVGWKGWKGAPDKIKLSDLINKMNQDKLFEQARTRIGNGVDLGSAFTELDKKHRIEAIWWPGGYFSVCAATTVAGDAVKGPIGWGEAIFDVATNCFIPAVWASMPLWGNTTAKIQEYIKAIPGGILNTIKGWFGADTTQASANSMSSQDNDTSLFWQGELSGNIRNLWKSYNMSKYVTRLADPKLGQPGITAIGDELTDEIMDQMMKKVHGDPLPSALPTEWGNVKTRVKASVIKQLKDSQNKLKKLLIPHIQLGKQWEEVLKDLPGKAATEGLSHPGSVETLMTQIATTGSSPVLRGKVTAAAIDDLISSDLSKNLGSRTIMFEAGDSLATRTTKASALANYFVNRSPTLAGDAAAITEVQRIIGEGLNIPATTAPPYGPRQMHTVTVSDDDIKAIQKRVMEYLKTKPVAGGTYADEVVAKSTTAIQKTMGKEMVETASQDLKAGKGKTLLKSKWASFGYNMVTGLLITTLSNMFGVMAFDKKMETLTKDLGPTSGPAKLPAVFNQDTTDPELQNGETYKVVITEEKDAKGNSNKRYSITPVKDLSSIPDKAKWINLDCEGKWAEKGIELPADFRPSDEKIKPVFGEQVSIALQVGYYNYAPKIKTEAANSVTAQEKLLAVLTADSMARYDSKVSVKPNNCGNWLDATSKAIGEERIQCVAGELKKAGDYSNYFSGMTAKDKQLAIENAFKAEKLWASMKTTTK